MKTLRDIVLGCENYLGYATPYQQGIPQWVTLRNEVNKLKKAMGKHPAHLATVENLALALEYSRRKRIGVKTPASLLWRIEEALELAYVERPVSELDARVAAAISWEKDADDEQSLRWIFRLVRCAGPGRSEVLDEWKAASRG